MLSSTALEHKHRGNPEWTMRKASRDEKRCNGSDSCPSRLRWQTSETSHNTAFVRAFAEAPFSGAAAGASWSAWNDARRSIVKPAAYAGTKAVKGYEKLAILSLIFVLRRKGSKTEERMKEEEIEKGNCRPPTRKVFFWDFVGLEPSGT